MSKSFKGQVTIFAITGFVLFLIVISYMFLSNSGLDWFSGPPGEIRGVVKFTESCVESLAEEGAFQMQMQGGYINVPDDLKYWPGGVLQAGFRVPMWYFRGKDYMPTLDEMESQLAGYIKDNLGECLAGYKDFPEFKVLAGPVDPVVRINSDSIFVDPGMYLNISKESEGKSWHWDEFKASGRSKLGYLYDLASDIMMYENRNNFLEDYVDEMMACSDYLPYEGMEITCRPRIFFESEMKDYTQTLIMHNLHFFQFMNTDHRESGIDYYDKLYKIYFTDKKFDDLRVDVVYDPAWGMEFKAVPSKNGIVKPYEFKAFNTLNTCLKIYHTRFNMEFPVLFTITDTKDPENTFFFATPVIMRRNLPNRNNEIEPWPVETEEPPEYCQPETEVTLYDLGPDNQIVVRDGMKNNRKNKLRVFAVDALYGFPDGVLRNVNISYQCVGFRCPIGTTQYERYEDLIMTESLPKLHTGFPECQNGLLIAEKPGYHTAFKTQTVSEKTDGEQVIIDMYRLKPMDFSVMVIEEHNGVVTDRPLMGDETAIITLTNKEYRYEETVMSPTDSDYFGNLSLMLGYFTYDLSIMLSNSVELLGGAEMQWSPDLGDIFNNDEVIFYVYKKDPLVPPQTPEEFYEMYEYSVNQSVEYPPRFR